MTTGETTAHVVVKLVDPEPGGTFRYRIECPGRPKCAGVQECWEPHEVDGRAVDPYEADPDDPWFGAEDVEFHGVLHTWHDCYGWTVPFDGCVVAAHYAWPDEAADQLIDDPPGRYRMADHWRDDEMTLELLGPAEPE